MSEDISVAVQYRIHQRKLALYRGGLALLSPDLFFSFFLFETIERIKGGSERLEMSREFYFIFTSEKGEMGKWGIQVKTGPGQTKRRF